MREATTINVVEPCRSNNTNLTNIIEIYIMNNNFINFMNLKLQTCLIFIRYIIIRIVNFDKYAYTKIKCRFMLFSFFICILYLL